MRHFSKLLLAALPWLAGPAFAAEDRVTFMVFDASGSMWAQLEDGKSRIEIAREVIDGYAGSRDSQAPIGVVAYGHNRRGDCGDIEAVLPLGAYPGGELAGAIRGLNPRGMTPLTDAMAMARDMIPRTAEAADIILVTDGLENCGGDPCALAAEMAASGIDIRAHVVGFALDEAEVLSLSCVPEQTGGQLFTTSTGAELTEALAVVTAPEPEPETVELRALDGRDMSVLGTVTWDVGTGEGAAVFHGSGGGSLTLDLMPGGYAADASAPGFEGMAEFDVTDGMEGPVDIVMDKTLATVLVAGEDARTGEMLSGVAWTVLDIATESAETFRNGGGGFLPLHLEPGEYRIEGELGDMAGGTVVAAGLAEDLRVTVKLEAPAPEPEATIDAPAETVTGSTIEIAWEGPDDKRDYITVVEPGAPDGSYTNYQRTSGGNPLSLQMPDALGAHELRYVHQQTGRTLASRPITLTPATARLGAPAEAVTGSTVGVIWEGPDNHRDYITVVEAGAPEGSYTDYERTSSGSPVDLQMPDALGRHELRYVLQQSGRTLASRPIELLPANASVSAPAEIPAGSGFDVAWEGPDNHRDYITIVPAGAPEGTYTDYARTSSGSPVTLQAPDSLGAHEVRYVIQQSGRTLASQKVTLVPVSAQLSVDGPVVPGGSFEVRWTGPDNNRDYITIVEPGAPQGSYTDYQRTSQGSPVVLTAPEEAGTYELRYVIQQSGRTLAALPLEVGAGEVTLSVEGPVTAGGVVNVVWQGPGRFEDLIEIVAEGAAADAAAIHDARASQGSPAQLFAPPAAGMYELRYRASDSGEVLARIPLEVE